MNKKSASPHHHISTSLDGDHEGDITVVDDDILTNKPPLGDSSKPTKKDTIGWEPFLGALLSAVVTLALGYKSTRPDLALLISAIVLIGGCLAGYLITKKAVVWGIIAAAMAVPYILILIWSPWCTLRQIRVQVKSDFTLELLPVVDHQVNSTGEDLEIDAYEFGGLTRAENLVCVWKYSGDGEELATANCSILIRSGSDELEDLVVVEVSKAGCWCGVRSQMIESLFISHSTGLED